MNKLKLDNYVKLKQGIKEVLDEFKNITDYSKYAKRIIDLLENNNYEFIESAVCLYNYINEGSEKGSIDFNKLEGLLEELYYDLLLKYDIKLYFIGEDKISLLTDKYLKISVSNLENINFNEKNVYNILIVEDKNTHYDKEKFDKVYDYYNLINEIEAFLRNFYNPQTYIYSYYYLKNELVRCKKEINDTLVVGISYALRGVDKNLLNEKALALYMGSQDIYYSYKMVKQAITFNKSFKKCIIGIGYYSFYYDMSLSKNVDEFVPLLYKLMLNDVHNFNQNTDIQKYESALVSSIVDKLLIEIFIIKQIQEDILNIFYSRSKNYYNDQFNKIDVRTFNGKTFNEINIDEKMKHTKYYTELHNKKLKYKNTRDENLKIFKEFLKFLEKNNVEPIVVVFPHSKYYNENLNPEYKKDLYIIMNEMKKDYKFKFIDLNEYGKFEDSDFIDADHLNENGANKATRYLNELIYE